MEGSILTQAADRGARTSNNASAAVDVTFEDGAGAPSFPLVWKLDTRTLEKAAISEVEVEGL